MRGTEVGLERLIRGTVVKVASAVKVGAGVKVGATTGRATAVWVEAELAVWAMMVPIEFGSSVEMGATVVGAQARINIAIINQRSKFLP